MKKDDNIPITKEKKSYLIGGAIAAVIVIIVLCILIWRRPSGSSSADISSLIAEELSTADLDYLPSETSQLDKIADTTADVLNRLSETGTDREGMIHTTPSRSIFRIWRQPFPNCTRSFPAMRPMAPSEKPSVKR